MSSKTRPARDRGADCRVVQLNLGGVDRRRIRGERGGQLGDKRGLGVELLLGGVILLREGRVSGEIELSVAEIGFVLRLLCGRLFERGLKRPRIDLSQQITLADHLAFLEADLDDLAVDTRARRNRIESLDLSEAFEGERKVGSLDLRN